MDHSISTTSYVSSPCDQVLHDMQRSVVIYGARGSGKYTALAHLQQRWQEQVLFINWDPSQPKASETGDAQTAVYQSICTAVAQQVADEIENQPQVLVKLPTLCKEFLRWLFVNGLLKRTVEVKRRLIPELDALFRGQEEKELFSDYGLDSVRSQIDEMVLLARELGYTKMVLLYYAPSDLSPQAMERLVTLVGWRDLWQQRNFVFKAALHTALVEQGQLMAKALGRIEFRRLWWSMAECRLVADAWARSFSQGDILSLQKAAEVALLDAETSYLQDIRGEFLPADWKFLAELLIDLVGVRQRSLSNMDDGAELRRRLYRRLAPLQIEADRSGVRRGVRRIKVREQPLRVLELLSRIRSGESRQALLALTGSPNNLHKQISELRKAIEPPPHGARDWVYICNTAEGNYVLEGALEQEPVRNR